LRHPVTDIALLSYIAKKNARVVSYTEATKACKSSSSASRALHQLINEGLLEPKPKLIGLRYVTQYVVTQKGKQVADLALQLTQLRETAAKTRVSDAELLEEVVEVEESTEADKLHKIAEEGASNQKSQQIGAKSERKNPKRKIKSVTVGKEGKLNRKGHSSKTDALP
jgi:hypothetical protein